MSLSNKYYSHPGKSLCEHLHSVAVSAKYISQSKLLNTDEFIERKIIDDTAFIIGASHDFGKFTSFFQEYLFANEDEKKHLKNKKETNHAFLSALFSYHLIDNYLKKLGKRNAEYYEYLPIIAFVTVRRHHGNLENFLDEVIIEEKDIEIFRKQLSAINKEDVRKFYSELLNEFKIDFSFLENFADENVIGKIVFPNKRKIRKLKTKENLFYYTLSLFFYSVLLDADKTNAAELRKFEPTEIESDVVDKYKDEKFGKNYSGINETREKIYKEVILQIEKMDLQNEKIFSINAPTGSGKTLTSFSFAVKLRNRISHELNFTPRIIYSLPFLSIIEQNHSVIDEVLNFPPSNVLLKHHHLSETIYTVKNDNENDYSFDYDKSKLLIEGWNADVVVTTFAQFFLSVITNRNRSARKFHNIVNSIVIFDEIQAIPHKYWLLLNELIGFLSAHFNIYFVLMTATRPAILTNAHELLIRKSDYFSEPSRYKLELETEKQNLEQFTEKLLLRIGNEIEKTYLIVMNTVNTSIEIYNKLKEAFEEQTEIIYLSTNIIPKERIARIEKIKQTPKKPKIIVSTQIIEAGVDLDADVVYRDFAPLDAINQTAGRCNRNFKKPLGEVYLVNLYTESDSGRVYFPQKIYDDFLLSKTKETLETFTEIEEKDFHGLTEKYFSIIDKTKSDDESLSILSHVRNLEFEELSKFKLIRDDIPSVDIFVELDDEAETLWKEYEMLQTDETLSTIEKKHRFLKIRKRFFEYVISIPKNYGRGLFVEGEINKISREEIAQAFYYNREYGFIRKEGTNSNSFFL